MYTPKLATKLHRRTPIRSVQRFTNRTLATSKQEESTSQSEEQTQQQTASNIESKATPTPAKKAKTVAELDEELRQKMAGHAGDGGDAGVEYEDGQPVAMKRSVKNNMFRYI